MKIEIQLRKRELVKSLNRVRHAAGKDEPRLYLNSIVFEIYPLLKRVDLIGTNGIVLAVTEMKLKGKKITPEISHSKMIVKVVPIGFFKVIDAVLTTIGIDDLVFIEFTDDEMKIKGTGLSAQSGLRVDTFPNYKEVLKTDEKSRLGFPVNDLKKIVTDLMKSENMRFSKRGDGLVKFHWHDKGGSIVVLDKKTNKDCKYDFEVSQENPVNFCADGHFLMQALKSFAPTDRVDILFTANGQGLLFSAVDYLNEQLIMLLKTNNEG